MSPLIRAALASGLVLGSLVPANARPPQPVRVRVPHPQRQTQIVVRRRFPPIHRAPTGVLNRFGNGITTRKVFLWAQPAKIEPHIREVPNDRGVQVMGSQDGFYAVIMHDGLRGWLPRDAVRQR